jgi:hypothetical protein
MQRDAMLPIRTLPAREQWRVRLSAKKIAALPVE